jgi:hypothetical protein
LYTFYKKACQCTPELSGPFIQYAKLAMRNNQWELALERWKILRSDFPENPLVTCVPQKQNEN